MKGTGTQPLEPLAIESRIAQQDPSLPPPLLAGATIDGRRSERVAKSGVVWSHASESVFGVTAAAAFCRTLARPLTRDGSQPPADTNQKIRFEHLSSVLVVSAVKGYQEL
jgi:hypothetical protein